MTARLIFITCVIGLAGAGCDDRQECLYAAQEDIAPANQLRDPSTGVCQGFGGECNDPCNPCPLNGTDQAIPDWAQCYAQCEGLGETTCKATSGCRAIYAAGMFHDCWGTAPSGPIQGGDCTTLDAQGCSRHDDCVAMHAAGTPIGGFQSCAAETAIQDPGSCVGPITCGDQQPMCPANTLPGKRNGCWTGYCIPLADCDELPACSELNEMNCIGRADCSPIYAGQNCTCTSTGCTCQSWVFDSCKTR